MPKLCLRPLAPKPGPTHNRSQTPPNHIHPRPRRNVHKCRSGISHWNNHVKFDRLISPHTSIPLDLFIRSLKFIMTHNSYFQVNKQIFKQTKGLTMGGQLSYILAEIVTTHGLLQAIIQCSIHNITISSIHKYIDDILIFTNGDTIQTDTTKRNIDILAHHPKSQ